MGLVYLVQHAEKERGAGDPGLTERGRDQARRAGKWLRHCGLGALYSSPLHRAVQTAQFVATAMGLEIREDCRLRERMNWDGTQPIDEFMAEWTRTVDDRDFVPHCGDSSRAAGDRFLEFLTERVGDESPIAVVTHGGVTVDLLRTLVGDRAVAPRLLSRGVPACAITTLDGLTVVEVAATAHLSH